MTDTHKKHDLRDVHNVCDETSIQVHKRVKRTGGNDCGPTIRSSLNHPTPSSCTNEGIVEMVKRLTSNYTQIIPRDILRQEEFKRLDWGDNGIGNRWGRQKFNYAMLMSNRKLNLYSEYAEDTCEHPILKTIRLPFYSSIGQSKTPSIVGIFVFSEKDTRMSSRTIADKIRTHFTGACCVACGSSCSVVIDHKNDLYNDTRALHTASQRISDFQPLCNHCNLQKKAICMKEKKSKRLYSAKQIPRLNQSLFSFPWEKKCFDISDIHCKRDTYWYDPVEFETKIRYYMMYRIPINQMILRFFSKSK